MVVQELFREVAASHGHCRPTSDISVDQKSTVFTQWTKLRHAIVASSSHLSWVICCNVCREELAATGLLDRSPHCLHHLRNAFIHLAENLVALRLVVLDEVTSQPECVASLTERLWLQTEFRLDDGANNEATVRSASPKDAPHVLHIDSRSIEEPEIFRREVDVVDFPVLHIAHALIV